MPSSPRRLPCLLALSALVAGLLAGVPTTSAAVAPQWSDGALKTEIQNVNCPSLIMGTPYLENEVGVYVGQYVRPDNQDFSPVVGEVFDVHVVVATIGNNCAGTAPKIEIALPPGVTPAISAATPLRCYYTPNIHHPNAWGQIHPAQGCPTGLGVGTTNHPHLTTWHGVNPNQAAYGHPAWQLAQGTAIEIQVPVVANRQLRGIADASGCVCVVASVQTINGLSAPGVGFTWQHGSPATGAYQHLIVAPAPATRPPGQRELRVAVGAPRQRLADLRRQRAVAVTCRPTRVARCEIVASVDARTARRLGLRTRGKPRVRVASGRVEVTRADAVARTRLKLSKPAVRALRAARSPVRMRLVATAVDRGGQRAQATVTVRFRQ